MSTAPESVVADPRTHEDRVLQAMAWVAEGPAAGSSTPAGGGPLGTSAVAASLVAAPAWRSAGAVSLAHPETPAARPARATLETVEIARGPAARQATRGGVEPPPRRPPEETVEVSIGTIQVTVERPPSPPAVPAPAYRPAARPKPVAASRGDGVPARLGRHYLRT